MSVEFHNAVARGRATTWRDTSNDPRFSWTGVMDMTGTVSPGQVWIVAGLPGNGKTALLLNIVSYWLDRGLPWVYAGLEMADDLLVRVLAALRSDIPRYRVIEETLTAAEKDAIEGEMDSWGIGKYHFIPEVSLTPTEFIHRAETDAEEIGARVVILDHLHHLSYSDMFAELGPTVRTLKESANKTGLTYLVAAQLRKTGSRLGRWQAPELEDIKGAGAVYELADVVLFTHRQVMPDCNKEATAYLKGQGDPSLFEWKGRLALTQRKHRYGRRLATVPLRIHVPTDRITTWDQPIAYGSKADATREVA